MNVVLFQLKMAGLNTAFQESLAVYTTTWQDSMLAVPSTVEREGYAWLGDVSQLEEWNSELAPRGLIEFDFTIKNKRFGAAMMIYHDDISDERYGQTKIRVGDMAEKAKAFPSVLLRALRANGESGLGYDDQPFYSTTHVEGSSGFQSNLVAGTGTTVAQIQADFKVARKLLFGYKTDKGDVYVRSNPRLVAVCGPEMEIAIREGLMLTTVSAGGQNVYAGMVSAVEVDQGITGNSWYLEDRSPRVKAFLLQEREVVTPKFTAPGSDTDVKEDATLYTVKWRGNAGYGQWKHSVKIKNA